MIQFTKLRLSGFKSFVEKTELEIGPGLNGIVGPNGCGKSNLVEALRWVMGESSAKKMRGGGMEDVIFAGTNKRSRRNIAEVSLLLDNNQRQAPAAYNNNDDIEVVRKIERDKGSGYKINGKNARARDVQMLFADTVTGSNSPALVSQGHVTRMINAKPHDRRLILEESAGISGLYARRHEAELRLRAADTNLERVEDIIGSMENRLNSLKRQARQAAKYKNLSAQIRQLDLIITYLEWQTLIDKQSKTKNEFAEAESIVAEKLTTVTQLTKTQNTQIEELPPLRKQEAEVAATLQKKKLDFERLEEEVKRYNADLKETKDQLAQTQTSKQHEEQTVSECETVLERVEVEHKSLLTEQKEAENSVKDKKELRNQLKLKVTELEERFTALRESAAESRAREDSLKNQIERNQSRMNVLLGRKKNAEEEKSSLVIDENSQKTIEELKLKTQNEEKLLSELNSQTDDAREDISKVETRLDISREDLTEAQKKHTEFSAEISMLEQFFSSEKDEQFTPVLDEIVTTPGFEKALSRAFGDSISAALDPESPSHWVNAGTKTLPELPTGINALLPHVKAPKELHLALSQIGFVESQEQGDNYANKLTVGQSLVSADGHYWRWDGYTIKADALDRNTVYLEQKNKLIDLEQGRENIETTLHSAQEKVTQDQDDLTIAKQSYDNLLNKIKTTEKTLKDLRPALQKIRDKNLRIESEQKRFESQINALDEDIETLQDTLNNDQTAYNTLIESQDESEHSEEVIEDVKLELDHQKQEYQNAVREFDILEQQINTRLARIQAIADERVAMRNRSIRSKDHLQKLSSQEETLATKLNQLEQSPVKAGRDTEHILDLISDLESDRNKAAERLAQCEQDVSTTNKALKEAEGILGSARERRASAQTMLGAVNEQLTDMESSIRERLNIPPKDLVNHSVVDLVKYQPADLTRLKKEKDQITRERDSIGAVNLRAEEETAELETEVTTLLNERNDLMQAIEELRGGINKINKEARERLVRAFEHVNAHFQRLFVRLFDGGNAYLELIDSDDPLGAGLEIFAQPPGKALQSLSLLSGGEQTLASIALIFSMFLTNPSPICVLDEIDAPLDDANVNRVCDLLDEIAERGETRFLVITHHRLSMARMDRLYGVTMAERGVSQLVSVDLQQSFDFIDKKVA